jgi:hypothetical protein
MPFEVGDVVIAKGTVFKDSHLYDPHESGRPVLVIHNDGQIFYYLVMSKSVGLPSDLISNYNVTNRLSKKLNHSFILFQDIYKGINDGQEFVGKLPINYVNLILKKLVYFQENIQKDDNYDEIKENIKGYIARSEVEYDEAYYRDHRKKR